MQVTIKKWGNSQGIILPKEIMELMNAKIGDALDAVIDNGKLTLQPAKKKFTHKTLEERMDETGLQLSFGHEIEWGESRGSELW